MTASEGLASPVGWSHAARRYQARQSAGRPTVAERSPSTGLTFLRLASRTTAMGWSGSSRSASEISNDSEERCASSTKSMWTSAGATHRSVKEASEVASTW